MIIVIGGGGSGKDYLRKKFENRGFKQGVHHTTRPKRDSEVEGEDYYFIDEKSFQEMISNNHFIEYSIHNNWFYGLTYDEFENCDLLVLSMKSYFKYPAELKDKSFKIFLDIPEDVRRGRLSMRNDVDSVDRRIGVDDDDLRKIDIKEFDLVIKNSDF